MDVRTVTQTGLLDVLERRDERVLLQVGVQPPARAVYQRLLKPRPSVYLILPPLSSTPPTPAPTPTPTPLRSSDTGPRPRPTLSPTDGSLRQLYAALDSTVDGDGVYVSASVVRRDTGAALSRSIDGVSRVKLEKCGWHEGVYKATFDKLKLRVTSSQCAGSKFVLCFGLRCRSLELGHLARMTVCTTPIEVYSHLQYLAQAEDAELAEARAKAKAKTRRDPLKTTTTMAAGMAEDGGGPLDEPVVPVHSKYGINGVGLQLKIMQLIHAFREQGGAESLLHHSVSVMYRQPLPTRRSQPPLPSSSSVPSSSSTASSASATFTTSSSSSSSSSSSHISAFHHPLSQPLSSSAPPSLSSSPLPSPSPPSPSLASPTSAMPSPGSPPMPAQRRGRPAPTIVLDDHDHDHDDHDDRGQHGDQRTKRRRIEDAAVTPSTSSSIQRRTPSSSPSSSLGEWPLKPVATRLAPVPSLTFMPPGFASLIAALTPMAAPVISSDLAPNVPSSPSSSPSPSSSTWPSLTFFGLLGGSSSSQLISASTDGSLTECGSESSSAQSKASLCMLPLPPPPTLRLALPPTPQQHLHRQQHSNSSGTPHTQHRSSYPTS